MKTGENLGSGVTPQNRKSLKPFNLKNSFNFDANNLKSQKLNLGNNIETSRTKSVKSKAFKKVLIQPDEYYEQFNKKSPDKTQSSHRIKTSNDFFATARSKFSRTPNRNHIDTFKSAGDLKNVEDNAPYWLNIGIQKNVDAITNEQSFTDKTIIDLYSNTFHQKPDKIKNPFSLPKSAINKTFNNTMRDKVESANNKSQANDFQVAFPKKTEVEERAVKKLDQNMVSNVEDWHSNKIKFKSSNNLKHVFRKTDVQSLSDQQFMKQTTLKNPQENDNTVKEFATRAPVVNCGMIDEILKQPTLTNEEDKKVKTVRPRFQSTSNTRENTKYNAEILEHMLKAKLTKQAMFNTFTEMEIKKKVYDIHNIKEVGNDIKSRFRCIALGQSMKVGEIYQKVEHDFRSHIENVFQKKQKIDQKSIVARNQHKRQLIEDFNIRYQIYTSFFTHEKNKTEMSQEMNSIMIKKVQLQNECKYYIETMTNRDGIKYKNVLKLMRNKTQQKQTYSMNPSYSEQQQFKTQDGEAKYQEWAKKLKENNDQQNTCENKLQELKIKYRSLKDEKKKQKLILKTLYFDLLKEPQLVCEQGVMIEDIVVFIKVALKLHVHESDLCEYFLLFEKQFILQTSNIKITWIQASGLEEQFANKFSMKDTNLFKELNMCEGGAAAGVTNRFTITGFKSTGKLSKKKPEIYTNYVNNLLKSSKERIDTNLASILKDNIKISEIHSNQNIRTKPAINVLTKTNSIHFQDNSYLPNVMDKSLRDQTEFSHADPFFFVDNQPKEILSYQQSQTGYKTYDDRTAVDYIENNQKKLKEKFLGDVKNYCNKLSETNTFDKMESLKFRGNFLFCKHQRIEYLNFLNGIQKSLCFEGTKKTDPKRLDVMNFASIQVENAKKNYRNIVKSEQK